MKSIIKLILIVAIVLTAVSCEEDKKPTYDQLLDEHEKNNSITSAIYGILVLGIFVYVGYKVGTSLKAPSESIRKNKFDGPFLDKDDDDNFHPTV
jgi:fucose permease